MKNKIILPIIIVIAFVGILIIAILRYRSEIPAFLETIPLISRPTPTPITIIASPTPTVTPEAGISAKTNISSAISGIDNAVSLTEKTKISEDLPLRTEDFSTSVGIKTTINIYELLQDPESAIRLEIYNINYNNRELTGPDAIAFKESFLEAKKQLVAKGVNLKNLQIIFGNRQYIQTTAVFWVKSFNLL